MKQLRELKQEGGQWLAEARSWLQWNTLNGDSVEWGSDDTVRGHLTVRNIEDLAAHVALPLAREVESLKDLIADVVNDYNTAGCDGCGTISETTYRKILAKTRMNRPICNIKTSPPQQQK